MKEMDKRKKKKRNRGLAFLFNSVPLLSLALLVVSVLPVFARETKSGGSEASGTSNCFTERSTDDSVPVEEIIKKSGRMLFSAHRGAEGQAPYGSYPSYLLACQQGWDMIQIASARQSADGTWYCLHDPTVDDQTNGTGFISELSDSYLSTIYQDDGVDIARYSREEMRLPKLEEIIKLAREYGVLISIRMGSLPGNLDSDESVEAWQSFISLCSAYNPYKMMFSGTPAQFITLKTLTDNWHGQIYVTSGTIEDTVGFLHENDYSNCSILASRKLASDDTIREIHRFGYFYVCTQNRERTFKDFIDLQNASCDIVQTGLSGIHSL